MNPKFIQLACTMNVLYALDNEGGVWYRSNANNPPSPTPWIKLEDVRAENRPE